MKRIKAACLAQTVAFAPKDDIPREEALNAVGVEAQEYKSALASGGKKYELLSEETLQDGTIVLKVKKQYMEHSCEGYID